MNPLFESITKRLADAWRTEEPSGRGHSYRSACGRPVYFRNSCCLGCQSELGYEPELAQVRALVLGTEPNTWRIEDGKEPVLPKLHFIQMVVRSARDAHGKPARIKA